MPSSMIGLTFVADPRPLFSAGELVLLATIAVLLAALRFLTL